MKYAIIGVMVAITTSILLFSPSRGLAQETPTTTVTMTITDTAFVLVTPTHTPTPVATVVPVEMLISQQLYLNYLTTVALGLTGVVLLGLIFIRTRQ